MSHKTLYYKNEKKRETCNLTFIKLRYRQTPKRNEQWRNNVPTLWKYTMWRTERTLPIYAQNEHWLLLPSVKFGEFLVSQLKQNAFLHQWIYLHWHCEYIHFFCNQCSNNENFISSKKNVEFSNIMPTSEEIAIFKEDIVYIFLI